MVNRLDSDWDLKGLAMGVSANPKRTCFFWDARNTNWKGVTGISTRKSWGTVV